MKRIQKSWFGHLWAAVVTDLCFGSSLNSKEKRKKKMRTFLKDQHLCPWKADLWHSSQSPNSAGLSRFLCTKLIKITILLGAFNKSDREREGERCSNKMHDWHFKGSWVNSSKYSMCWDICRFWLQLQANIFYLTALLLYSSCFAVLSHILLRCLPHLAVWVFDASWRNRCQNANLEHKLKAGDENKANL